MILWLPKVGVIYLQWTERMNFYPVEQVPIDSRSWLLAGSERKTLKEFSILYAELAY